jgi:hypothetical protein
VNVLVQLLNVVEGAGREQLQFVIVRDFVLIKLFGTRRLSGGIFIFPELEKRRCNPNAHADQRHGLPIKILG